MKEIAIIGVEMDLGQSRRGVDMGPNALRYAGLDDRLRQLGYTVKDYGNITTPLRDTLQTERKLAFLPSVTSVCEEIYQLGCKVIATGQLPVFLGGDHSIAIGSIGGVTPTEPSGVLWIDAHGDFNTPATSPSGNLHGMSLAALLGHGASELVNLGRPGPKLTADQVVLIGARDLNEQERQLLIENKITIYTMREIDARGIATVTSEALDRLNHLPRLHISLDMDALDPMEASGVGIPVPGGLTYREAHLLMEIIADCAYVGSVDIVEINPILDQRNHTSELAVELITSLLRKKRLPKACVAGAPQSEPPGALVQDFPGNRLNSRVFPAKD
uniref:Arginase n=1 Tax=Candidatus Kentrum sp. UNK TaxID=2126344 RepID=A0A451B229_9GAMM|nr:MAG: arginase [Candidatus Kentron sp. UNK]VFK72329.1 MAG: arginase [Candidatus Kentron sp. UNK]